MLDTFACPVCGDNKWSEVETFVYARTDGIGGGSALSRSWHRLGRIGQVLLWARPRKRVVCCRTFSPYQLLRRKVLFETWFPGTDNVTLTSCCCRVCGFMTYAPRPDERDVSAKYTYLKQVEPDVGGQSGYDSKALLSDATRAERVFDRCLNHLGRDVVNCSEEIRVLDYGGGNGKLLRPFASRGHSCYLVDYNDHPVPGVTKICDDMSSFPENETFDLIICSHVLEHVSDPSRLISFLGHHLNPGGVLYVEVPGEIWAGLNIESDPVTHINFFTERSLNSLLLRNGFGVLESRQQIANYGNMPLEVIWAVVSKRSGGADIPQARDPANVQPGSHSHKHRDGSSLLPADVWSLLHPRRRASLRRIYRLSVAPKLKRVHP